jgi:O-antigen ligase
MRTYDLNPAIPHAIKKSDDSVVWMGIAVLWFLHLARPLLIVGHYIPSLQIVQRIPTLCTLFVIIIWMLKCKNKKSYGLLIIYFGYAILTSLFAENTGRARGLLIIMLEANVLFTIFLSYSDTDRRCQNIISLYILSFIFLGIWGLIGRGLIAWDYLLDNEDAFGPLMCIGVAFCSQSYLVAKSKLGKVANGLAVMICICGVVASFARGAFICLIAVFIFLLFRSKQKIKGILVVIICGGIILVAAQTMFENDAFWTEMESSTKGTEDDTGHDRAVLWSVAWEEFKDNPLIGVGPMNYGINAPKYILRVKDRGGYSDPMRIWGKATHNGYFQTLSEMGIIGTIIYIIIIVEFFRTNYVIKRLTKKSINESKCLDSYSLTNELCKKYYYISIGSEAAMLAFLLNMIFYDTLYYNWFFDLLIINRALYNILTSELKHERIKA